MSDEKHETIADIVRKMRHEIAELRKVSPNVRSIAADWWEARADEIEAAHKREVEKLNSAIQATVSRSDAEIDRLRREIAELKRAGNVAKLREAAYANPAQMPYEEGGGNGK